MTISKLQKELNRICDEFGLEKKVVAYRNTPAGEHGYLKAYEIYKRRRDACDLADFIELNKKTS